MNVVLLFINCNVVFSRLHILLLFYISSSFGWCSLVCTHVRHIMAFFNRLLWASLPFVIVEWFFRLCAPFVSCDLSLCLSCSPTNGRWFAFVLVARLPLLLLPSIVVVVVPRCKLYVSGCRSAHSHWLRIRIGWRAHALSSLSRTELMWHWHLQRKR